MRFYFPIINGEELQTDPDGKEFSTIEDADNHGARIASEIGMDDQEYPAVEVLVLDAGGNEIARHPVYRRLAN